MRVFLLLPLFILTLVGLQAQSPITSQWPEVDYLAFRQKMLQTNDHPLELRLPGPEGRMTQVVIQPTAVLSQKLQAKYPGINTWSGYAKNNKDWRVRLERNGNQWSLGWFTEKGRFWAKSDNGPLFSYGRYVDAKDFFCRKADPLKPSRGRLRSNDLEFDQLITLRLALTTSYSFTQYHGGGKEETMAALVTIVNRLNEVYERDLGVHFVLPENADTLIVTDPDELNLPFGAEDLANQTFTDNRLGSTAYDVGHVLDIDSPGGYAFLGVVCQDADKAKGYTSAPMGEGDLLIIDFLAHEIGHQFGATHTFNGMDGSCFGNAYTPTAVEPGSGSTIMAYAGICGQDNIQAASDAFFHAVSAEQAWEYLDFVSSTTGCGTVTEIGHESPQVVSIPNHQYIPAGTPLVLDAEVLDPDSSTLLASWDQTDFSSPQFVGDLGQKGPVFRYRQPNAEALQFFPPWQNVIDGQFAPGDAWPVGPRTLHFSLFVRNPESGGSHRVVRSVSIGVTEEGPFVITGGGAPRIWSAGSLQEVSWSVANTHRPPVNLDEMAIWLVDESDPNYRILLAEQVPNNGKALIEVPRVACPTRCRVLLKHPDRVFFALSPYTVDVDTQQITPFVLKATREELSFCSTDTLAFSLYVGGESLQDSTQVPYQIEDIPGLYIQQAKGALRRGQPDTVWISGRPENGKAILQAIAVLGSTDTSFIQIDVLAEAPVTEFPVAGYPGPSDHGLVPYDLEFNWSELTGADFYHLELFRDGQLVGRFKSDSVHFRLTKELPSGATISWQVAGGNQQCGSGPFSQPNSFSTKKWSCDTFTFTETLSFSSLPFTTSVLPIPAKERISDVNVLAIEGAYPGPRDLAFRLRSPNGPSVDLTEQGGACAGVGRFSYGFDDAFLIAPDSCTSGFRVERFPAEPLAIYRGQRSDGDWRIFAFHRSNSDGFIDRITLEVCHQPEVVSVIPKKKSTNWMVFPNPVVDRVRFQCSTFTHSGYQIRIFHSSGQEMYWLEANDQHADLSVKDWPSGLYSFIIIEKGGDMVPTTGRFMVR